MTGQGGTRCGKQYKKIKNELLHIRLRQLIFYLQYNYNDYVLGKSYNVDDFSTFLDKIISLDYNKSDYYIYYRPFGDSLDSSIVDKDKELIYL